MKIKEIMSTDFECLTQDAVLVDAAEKMRESDIGSIPVCLGEKVIGMITDRDITVRAAAQSKDFRKTTVGEIMSKDVAFCFEDQDVSEAEKLMEEREVRRLVVLNRDRKLVGVVSLGDLSGVDDKMAGRVVGRVTEPLHAQHGRP